MSRKETDAGKDEVVAGLRDVREKARSAPFESTPIPAAAQAVARSKPLSALEFPAPAQEPSSPDRDELNRAWDVEAGLSETGGGLAAPLRSILRKLSGVLFGPVLKRQQRMNSLQVKFDNELVQYVDERIDRLSRHYDEVLGLHGKRMEEIDERHLILQQELVRHVHDLVARIDFVFESAEQNHLYLEGMLREIRDELSSLLAKLSAPPEEKP